MKGTKKFSYVRVFTVFLIIFSLLAGILFYAVVRSFGIFSVKRIEIKGAVRVSPEEIRKRSGIIKGKNEFFFFEDSVRRRIFDNPWIVEANITRDFPDQVSIQIKEADPFCLLLEQAGKLYYMSRNGKKLGRINSIDGLDFPVLIGEDTDQPEMVAEALKILKLSERSEILAGGEISEINLNSLHGITVYTVDRRRIDFGRGNVERKWKNMEKIITRGRAINLSESYINVSSERIGVVNPQL